MKFEEVKLPSNRKFGLFFSLIFVIISIYFVVMEKLNIAFAMFIIAFLFFVIAITYADLLLTLNKIWIKFGFFLGLIVSPIVMGVIFFGLITPISIITRIIGRDELRLKRYELKSYWITRSQKSPQTDFTQQF